MRKDYNAQNYAQQAATISEHPKTANTLILCDKLFDKIKRSKIERADCKPSSLAHEYGVTNLRDKL